MELLELTILLPNEVTIMQFYVYILSSVRRVIYVGFTNNLERRMYEHKHGIVPGFTRKYKCKSLVYYETTNDANSGIQREKQIKGWKRFKKVELIESMNLNWEDLSGEWFREDS
jgi:putative endonuclease